MVVEGDAEPRELDLESHDQVLIGRAEDCDLRVASDRVSRRHAALVRSDVGFRLEDLGSSTGTKVNGRLVRAHNLADGDRIEFAGVILEVQGGTPAAQGADRALLDGLLALLAGPKEEVEDQLADMLDRLVEAFEADRGAVYLPGSDGQIVCRSMRLAPKAALHRDDPVSRSFIAEVAAGDGPRLLSSAETAELRDEFKSIGGQLRSILAAPLPLGDTAGALYLDSAIDRRRFVEGDRDLLRAFANAAGVALDRERHRRRLARKADRTRERQRRQDATHELLGESPAMKAVHDELLRAAATDVTVLVGGESGTGKELVARALHRASKRSGEAFVAVNCAAIPPELVESELFGHEEGAFTGAKGRRLGQFELADGGTLLLDEVGELPLQVQGKLLRALQERQVQRVGASKPVRVDFRLVCATHRDLETAVKEGTFREDLFYRVAVYRLELPPLRDRGGDVEHIAGHFLNKFSLEFGRGDLSFSDGALAALRSHHWPGNVRELRNAVEQSAVRARGDLVEAGDLFPGSASPSGVATAAGGSAGGGGGGGENIAAYPKTLDEARREFERRYLAFRLGEHKGNMKGTAEALGISRRNLYTRCEELGLDYKQFR